MQYDNSDDPYGFWNDEPTRQLKRTQAGTRAHGDTGMVPVVRMDRTRPMPAPHRPNPLLARVGLMFGVMLLLIPIALSMRSDKHQVRAAQVQGLDPVVIGALPPPAPTEATLAPTTLAPSTVLVTISIPPNPPAIEVVATPALTDPPTDPPTTPAKAKKAIVKATTTLAPAATAAQSADKSCTLTYTIVSGDAWSSIASRAKVTMKALLAANSATVNTVLLPGKSICLPPGAVDPGPPSKPTSTTQPTTTQPKPSTTQPKPSTTKPPTTKPPTTQPPTPPQTTVPATTQPAPPANTYSKAQVAQIIRDVWPDDLEDEAIRIATRESNLIPTVRNACCYGLFQLFYSAHKSWLAGIGVTSPAQLYDPRINATAALALYNISGWAPWAISTPTTSLA
jgi:LysM repeat protein